MGFTWRFTCTPAFNVSSESILTEKNVSIDLVNKVKRN